MAFTGHENHSITLADAAQMTANFRATNPTGGIIAHFFGKDAIQTILNQTNCVGIRLYYGLDNSGVKQIIVTGVLANENDIYTGSLAERSIPCPQECSSANPLNTTT